MSDEDVTLNVEGLDKLIKAIGKKNLPTARVGILGDKTHRTQSGGASGGKSIPTNALIGAVHEFGSVSRGIPPRSFLRVPISWRLPKAMADAGALDKEVLREVIQSGTITPWLKKIAVLAEGIVMEAFDTGGFGKWEPHSPGYTNNTGQLLLDTQQLRNSITSEVKE